MADSNEMMRSELRNISEELDRELEQTRLLLERIREETGENVDEALLQARQCMQLSRKLRRQADTAGYRREVLRDMRMMPMLYGPNPCFKPKK